MHRRKRAGHTAIVPLIDNARLNKMSGTLAVLAIDLPAHDQLIEVFGIDAARRGLADFGAGLDGLFGRLLAQHEMLGGERHDADGRWRARFRIRSGGLPRDMAEACAAIEEAGRRLAHELLVTVFGMGTGMRLPLVLAVLPLPSEAAPDACPREWLEARLAALAPRSLAQAASIEAVDALLESRDVRTLLQPIVRLADRAVVGYEALSRGPAGSPLERPDLLFDAAHAAGKHVEMELLCAELALERTRGKLPPGCFLTVNLGPEALQRAAAELPLAGRADLMFELTEHLPLGGAEGLAAAVERLRAGKLGLALDDTGCGFADLDTVRVLRPEIVKLCITVVRNADKGSPYVKAIAETTRQLHELGCRVLAEGVETEPQHAALADCAIELAQGWLYGRPAPLAI